MPVDTRASTEGQTPIVEFRNVTKRFGDVTAIDNQSLSIFPQEFFALLGPSGCGKTTLMRMLAGFEAPTEGQILLDGQDLASVPPNKRAVNMMFQSYALFPHLTIWDNIAFGLKREGMAKADISARVDAMLDLTRLGNFASRKPHQCSGGQQQRVALARALAKAPKLLLLDEPMGALDAKLRQETQFELMEVQRQTGTTFMIVTHDQEEAMTVASRVAVMDHGRIVQVGTPTEIYEAPHSVYVADFIGDVNLIEGRVVQDGGAVALAYAEGADNLQIQSETQLRDGQNVTLAVRPEKIAISLEEPAQEANALRGRVIEIAYLGNVSTYHVRVPSGHILKAQMTNRERRSAGAFGTGDEVWLSWSHSEAILLVD
jgi:putrescine transport system ATP-binding protein